MRRELLKDVSRIVVKLGTGVLTDSRKQPDLAQMEQLVAQIAGQCRLGKQMVLVTSVAVGAGMGVLGYEKRPAALAELQACAAVGQSRLMATYDRVQPHVPDFQVAEALALAAEKEIDAVIGLGGGSPIGMASDVVPSGKDHLDLEGRRLMLYGTNSLQECAGVVTLGVALRVVCKLCAIQKNDEMVSSSERTQVCTEFPRCDGCWKSLSSKVANQEVEFAIWIT